MKRTVILIVVMAVVLAGMLMAALPAGGQNGPIYPIYVDDSATGANNGVSWEDAFVSLQDGLDALPDIGLEVWVARGTYYPDEGAAQQDGNRTSTFTLVGNVDVYGGFAGVEIALDQRDVAANPTVLSGDIQQDGCHGNNAYHVVTGADGAVLDGFIITGGHADGGSERDYGGGMYNISLEGLQVANCTFYDNWAGSGGGMFNDLGCDPQVSGCTFEGNRAVSGGGIANWEDSDPAVSGCTFRYNSASNWGGGMYNRQLTHPEVTDSTFEGNEADYGGGMYNWGYCHPQVSGCTFEGNHAEDGGGMMNYLHCHPQVTGCTFEGNRAENNGGGMYNWLSQPSLANCTFAYNSAETNGGGLHNDIDSDTDLGNCTFVGNLASSGGGVYNRWFITLTGCLFQGNWAEDDGGGMKCVQLGSLAAVTNCAFWGNRASGDGGGMWVGEQASGKVTNCSFHANSAGPGEFNLGGALYVDSLSSLTAVNCIMWGDCPDEIYTEAGASVTYCDVQGDWGVAADFNIDADPVWAHPGAGDLHLLPGSPCIEAGDNAAPNIPDFDFEGDPRIFDGDGNGTATVDMGVDELMLQSVEVFYDSFEDCSLTNWEQDVQNDWFCSTQRAYEGTHSAEVDGWANDAALTMAQTIDLSGATEATLSFWWYIESRLDDGEYLACDVWNGTAWVEVALLSGENYTGAGENMWHEEEVDLAGCLGADFKLRFRGKMSRYDEDANVDAVQIMATMP